MVGFGKDRFSGSYGERSDTHANSSFDLLVILACCIKEIVFWHLMFVRRDGRIGKVMPCISSLQTA